MQMSAVLFLFSRQSRLCPRVAGLPKLPSAAELLAQSRMLHHVVVSLTELLVQSRMPHHVVVNLAAGLVVRSQMPYHVVVPLAVPQPTRFGIRKKASTFL